MKNNTGVRKNRVRNTAAIAALVLGLSGATAAAAAQLNLNWTGTFQAGATSIQADCQPGSENITASFDAPAFAGTANLPWTIANVKFSGIDDACKGLTYEAAYKAASGDWVKLGTGTVGGATVSQALGSVDPQTVKQVAFTIYS